MEPSTVPETAALVAYDLTLLFPGLTEGDDTSAKAMCEALREQVQKVTEEFALQEQETQVAVGADEWVRKTARMVEETLEEPEFGITFMAQRYGMSDSAFSHMFKRMFGVSFIAYVNDVKIRRAQEMLRSSALSVEEIARRLGYSSASNFTRMFKSIVRMTPSLYRQQSRKV